MTKINPATKELIMRATSIVIDLIDYGYNVNFRSMMYHSRDTIGGTIFDCDVKSGHFTFSYCIGGLSPDSNNFDELFSELERLKQLAISGVFNSSGSLKCNTSGK